MSPRSMPMPALFSRSTSALIALRKKSPQLVTGAYRPIAAEGDLLLYRREGDGGALVIALNLGAKPVSIACTSIGAGREILLSTFLDRPGEVVEDTLDLRANEGRHPRRHRSRRVTSACAGSWYRYRCA